MATLYVEIGPLELAAQPMGTVVIPLPTAELGVKVVPVTVLLPQVPCLQWLLHQGQ